VDGGGNEPREPVSSVESNPATIQIVMWVVGLVIFALMLRACVSESEEPTPTQTATATETVRAIPATPAVSPGPTDSDKAEWFQIMENREASAIAREAAAKNLMEHFPDSSEGEAATSLLPELEKAVAYEAMGRQWNYSRSEEGMSGKAVRTARVFSTNTIDLEFPYGGPQRASLILRRHPRWGNDVILRIERGQILCHSYGDCRINVKFDDGKVLRFDGNPPDDNSSEVVFIPAFSTFMRQLPKSNTVKIEISIYQSGNQVFEFDVSGFKPEEFK
jgi:hypothetical protein